MSENYLQAPLFIIGSPRSGTSLLRLILTSHSVVIIPPECGFIIWLHEKHAKWCVADNNNINKVNVFINDLLACKKIDTWKLKRAEIKEKILIFQPLNYAELCAVVYDAFASSIGKKITIWGDKNNYYLHHLDELSALYCDAKFLHIVRDGRDVACSYREVMAEKSDSPYAPDLETNIGDIALSWSSNVAKIDSFMNKISDRKNRAMTVRYEDIVSEPLSTITAICDWLGISYEPNMLDFYQQNIREKLEPDLMLDWKKRTLQPISNDTVGRYVSMLSVEEKDEFSRLANSVLSRFSYSTN